MPLRIDLGLELGWLKWQDRLPTEQPDWLLTFLYVSTRPSQSTYVA